MLSCNKRKEWPTAFYKHFLTCNRKKETVYYTSNFMLKLEFKPLLGQTSLKCLPGKEEHIYAIAT